MRAHSYKPRKKRGRMKDPTKQCDERTTTKSSEKESKQVVEIHHHHYPASSSYSPQMVFHQTDAPWFAPYSYVDTVNCTDRCSLRSAIPHVCDSSRLASGFCAGSSLNRCYNFQPNIHAHPVSTCCNAAPCVLPCASNLLPPCHAPAITTPRRLLEMGGFV